MKALYLFSALICLSANSQTNSVYLDHNNTSLYVANEGNFFYDFDTPSSGYEVPNGSGLYTITASQFWFAGKTLSGDVHLIEGGDPGLGTDVFDGPYAATNIYNNPDYIDKWNGSVWKICQEEIDNFNLWWECANLPAPVGCENAQEPSAETLNTIYTWPAHGDTNNGESYYLAPFYDRNMDGVYNPDDGDYPIIKGCCATYMIQNDLAGLHTYSGTPSIGLEIHYMFYQYQAWNYLNDVTFVDITAINKGGINYPEFASGFKVDAEIGYYGDDFFGCDSSKNVMYFYNADNFDEGYYNSDPPAIGIVSLEKVMSSCLPHENASSAAEKWEILNGRHPNGQDWLGQNGVPTTYVFSGNPTIPSEWSELSVGAAQGDRLAISSSQHGSINDEDTIFMSYAILFSRIGDNLQNIQNIIEMSEQVKLFYDNESDIACVDGTWGIEEIKKSTDFVLYPNPNNGTFTIEYRSDDNNFANLKIVDLNGKLIQEFDDYKSGETITVNSNIEKGVYLVQLISESGSTQTKRVVIQ